MIDILKHFTRANSPLKIQEHLYLTPFGRSGLHANNDHGPDLFLTIHLSNDVRLVVRSK